MLDAISGIQFIPWLAVGGFLSASPLSDFEQARFAVSVGYLEDQDGEEGMDAAFDTRFFYATFSAGTEINLSRHTRFFAQAGGRLVANEGVLGIPTAGLSGFEARLGLRLLWRTVIVDTGLRAPFLPSG